jgi:hypothetical protein
VFFSGTPYLDLEVDRPLGTEGTYLASARPGLPVSVGTTLRPLIGDSGWDGWRSLSLCASPCSHGATVRPYVKDYHMSYDTACAVFATEEVSRIRQIRVFYDRLACRCPDAAAAPKGPSVCDERTGTGPLLFPLVLEMGRAFFRSHRLRLID